MLRTPVKTFESHLLLSWKRSYYSSNNIRKTFIDFFKDRHQHAFVKSSPVVPLCDPTVPFVNAGMNQFKGVFLGTIEPPATRVVNSQKCIRVGGKHNDLSVVGTDGYHHTFFEMLGNWSFGDYYKEISCKMAYSLMCEDFKINPARLRFTYFGGDTDLGIKDDSETKEIWKSIGVPEEHIFPCCAAENFWEMGPSGPCGPCTEIHYVNDDGSCTELWNIVFIEYNREPSGKLTLLLKQHVDTGMGLERMATLLQDQPCNFHTDLFTPIIQAIYKQSTGVPQFTGRYGKQAALDIEYRKLADHARMIAVCLADCAVPAANLNLKQIMRRAFRISTDVFQCPQGTMLYLYDVVAETLGDAYPELLAKEKDAKLIIHQEEESYVRLRDQLSKKFRALVDVHPEVAELNDIELPGFVMGYKVLKDAMFHKAQPIVPGELAFRLYDTHGFPEALIERVAELNNYTLDKGTFERLLKHHRNRHKASFKELNSDNKGLLFNKAIEELNKKGIMRTADGYKYDFSIKDNTFEPLHTNLLALLDSNGNLLYELSNPSQKEPYYIVTKSTNFYCEEGGQACDRGVIKINDNLVFEVDSVFKIRDLVFHKGFFKLDDALHTVFPDCKVILEIDSNKRLEAMKNHSATHILNAALRLMLPNSVVYQCGSKVTDKGHMLSLSVYGEKITKDTVMNSQQLVKNAISCNKPIFTATLNSVQLSNETGVTTVPGEVYPEKGLRLVQMYHDPLVSKELCCGTHVPSTAYIQDFFITSIKGIKSNTPSVYALAGEAAIKARKLFSQTETLKSFKGLVDKDELKQEVSEIKQAVTDLCGTPGTPVGNYAECLKHLDDLLKHEKTTEFEARSLEAIAHEEVAQATLETDNNGRLFTVHFLRCSYLMSGEGVGTLVPPHSKPIMLIACASGTLGLACRVPQDMVTETFSAAKWLSVVLPVFNAKMKPSTGGVLSPDVFAEMEGTKVSLINCEQLVSDAMRAAIRYANSHAHSRRQNAAAAGEAVEVGDDDKTVSEDQVLRLFSNSYKKGSN